MALTVQGGWLDGNNIRVARKQYKCQYNRGRSNGGWCRKPINPGDYYVEGEMDDFDPITRNGVFRQQKYCPTCAGIEAVATIAKIGT